MAQLVSRIGNKVLEASPAREGAFKFQFHLLRDPQTINAFALPGGQIFITVGLLNALQTEAQLAGVLGHEIGHVIHRHAAEHMASGQLGQTIAVAVGVAASDEYGRGQGAAAVAQVVNGMLQLKYGREDEKEADREGLKYIVSAGYDPRAMLGVMEVLKKAAGAGRQPEFMASHPHPESRLEEIRRFIAENYPNGVPSNLTQGRWLHGTVGAR
jgi:predicted Zn-dependent protease